MNSDLTTDIATRTEIGPRDRQEDRARAVENTDGSWMIAVADGLGGHPYGDEAAQAAVDALPERIADVAEMTAAFNAANAAAWALRPEMRSHNEGVSSAIALTTLVVAAWTPEGGLLLSWIGDSMGFVVPLGGGPGWHSTPHNDPFGFISRCIGMSRADQDSFDLPPGDVDHLGDDVRGERVNRWIEGGGLLVVLATDGLFGPILGAHGREWFSDDPDDNSLGFALPTDRRGTAADAADTLMDTARFAALQDNITIAVARITPEVSEDAGNSTPAEA
ncbi:PP2C family protein-serine/threonine phosphatase [Candidatus Poriferisodalis sp.]|uniref:PP2C family protein-serine/threonine phosphatase n=1 Tax=Candidatus Poriferisodalis sp. TaxID=3101277 RepID=UPI003B5BA7B9